MSAHDFDIVIIGSGAGGGTMARALAGTPARVLLLERGTHVPRETDNWDPAAVWKTLKYRTTEQWHDGAHGLFTPYTHYNVGGNTKFWGTVLYRLRREDFGEIQHLDGVSPAWPITYEDLAPYYDRAERLYHVHGYHQGDPTEPPRGPYPYAPVPHAAGMQLIVDALERQGLHPSYLPLGLIDPGVTGGCQLCNTCNSFPCRIHAKSDAEVCGVLPALAQPNVTLWDRAMALRLLTDPAGSRVEAVEVDRAGERTTVRAPLVIVSCGAANSAALLLRSATDRHPDGLANSSGLVGRRYMAHLATMLQGFHPLRRNETVFQKTVAINDFYLAGAHTPVPLGQIQSQGRTHAIMAKVVGDTITPIFPLWAYEAWCARGVDWLAMTEDLPRNDNRISLGPDGRIRLDYTHNNLEAHARLVRTTTRMLHRMGFGQVMKHSHKNKNTTHQCGTLVFGRDSHTSVLDTFCRTHDVDNLFVVDASFFPSSGAVNPGLTIAAQALRVADHIRVEHLGLPPGDSTP